jgi:predicted nucleic acid-binding protein
VENASRVTILVDTSAAVGDVPSELEDSWVISVVSVAELEAGILLATRRALRAQRLARLTAVLAEAPVLPVDRHVGTWYARLREKVAERKPHNDLWIAATALAHGLTLITADARQAALPLVRATLVEA